MSEFEIISVQSVEEIPLFLTQKGCRILAGGTSIHHVAAISGEPISKLININALEELHYIREHGNRIEIGPITTLAEIETSALCQVFAPTLCAASASIPKEIAEHSTLAGNLACSFRPEILTALLTLKAKVTVGIGASFTEYESGRLFDQRGNLKLHDADFISRVSFSKPTGRWGAHFEKSALLCAAALITIDDEDQIIDARIAASNGGVAKRLRRCERAMQANITDAQGMSSAVLVAVSELHIPPTQKHAAQCFFTDLFTNCTNRAQEKQPLELVDLSEQAMSGDDLFFTL